MKTVVLLSLLIASCTAAPGNIGAYSYGHFPVVTRYNTIVGSAIPTLVQGSDSGAKDASVTNAVSDDSVAVEAAGNGDTGASGTTSKSSSEIATGYTVHSVPTVYAAIPGPVVHVVAPSSFSYSVKEAGGFGTTSVAASSDGGSTNYGYTVHNAKAVHAVPAAVVAASAPSSFSYSFNEAAGSGTTSVAASDTAGANYGYTIYNVKTVPAAVVAAAPVATVVSAAAPSSFSYSVNEAGGSGITSVAASDSAGANYGYTVHNIRPVPAAVPAYVAPAVASSANEASGAGTKSVATSDGKAIKYTVHNVPSTIVAVEAPKKAFAYSVHEGPGGTSTIVTGTDHSSGTALAYKVHQAQGVPVLSAVPASSFGYAVKQDGVFSATSVSASDIAAGSAYSYTVKAASGLPVVKAYFSEDPAVKEVHYQPVLGW